jgi:hypothetical protein
MVIISAHQMRYLLYVLFALIVADGILSDYLVSQNLGRELNPVLSTLMGGGQFMLVKVCGALLVIILMWKLYKRQQGLAIIGSLCSLVFYTGIIYWNIFALLFSSMS